MTSEAFEQRVLAFAQDAKADDFGQLALALFKYQYSRFPLYRQRCEELDVAPATASNWREIPTAIASEPAVHASADFQDALALVALPDLVGSGRVRLVIDPESDTVSDPAIGILANRTSEKSFVCRGKGLAVKPLRSWLAARQRDRLAVQIVATNAGFNSLVELLERRALKFRLPPASTAVCVAPIDQASNSRWNPSLGSHLGIHAQAYRRVLCRPPSTPLLESPEATEATEAASRVFRLPHWVRRTADSEGLALLDLASIGAPAHRIEPSARSGADVHSLVLA